MENKEQLYRATPEMRQMFDYLPYFNCIHFINFDQSSIIIHNSCKGPLHKTYMYISHPLTKMITLKLNGEGSKTRFRFIHFKVLNQLPFQVSWSNTSMKFSWLKPFHPPKTQILGWSFPRLNRSNPWINSLHFTHTLWTLVKDW